MYYAYVMTKTKTAPLPKPYSELLKELDTNSERAFKAQGLNEEADFRAKLRAEFEAPIDSRQATVGEHATATVIELNYVPVTEEISVVREAEKQAS